MDEKIFDGYIPRKFIYSFFLSVAILIIIVIVIFTSFSQNLQIVGAEVLVIGTKGAIVMNLENISQHPVNNARVVIEFGSSSVEEYIPNLLPGQDYNFYKELDIPEDGLYKVSILSPNNTPIRVNFELSSSTIDPVTAEVILSRTMVLGEKYENLSVKLCNVSTNNLPDVKWVESFSSQYFLEEGLSRSVSLNEGACKTLYFTLTPIKAGTTKIDFKLNIGAMEKSLSQELIILDVDED
jgi:hypothetical protein